MQAIDLEKAKKIVKRHPFPRKDQTDLEAPDLRLAQVPGPRYTKPGSRSR